jgi:hypothetical protein
MTNQEITPEIADIALRALYHHPRSSATIVEMLTGVRFDTPPLPPTAEEEAQVHDAVEETITLYHSSFRSAVKEVLGEDPEDWVL